MRTDMVLFLAFQSISFSAEMMFLRAFSLSSGATASSMSRKMQSAALSAAFSIMVGFDPGTASVERWTRILRRL